MAAAVLIPFSFYQRLSVRERVLLLAVAGTIFLLANMLAIGALAGAFGELRHACAEQTLNLQAQRLFARDQPKWTQRMAWLRGKQPVLGSRDRAGTSLLDQVQQIARGCAVIVTNPQIKPVPIPNGENRAGSADYQAVTVEVDTQSDWTGLNKFIERLQQPDSFLVCDLATLRSDADPAAMKGHFQISKWYAPAGR